MRTAFLAALLALGSTIGARADNDLVKTFAYCAGRLSAEVEHAWLMPGVDPEPLEDRRADTLALLAAVVEDPDTGPALTYRIHAKHAHASLLRAAAFHPDGETAGRARRLAMARLRACSSMLLG